MYGFKPNNFSPKIIFLAFWLFGFEFWPGIMSTIGQQLSSIIYLVSAWYLSSSNCLLGPSDRDSLVKIHLIIWFHNGGFGLLHTVF